MQTIERNKYIEEICRKKNLNSETLEYIKQYMLSNLFKDFCNSYKMPEFFKII